MTTSRPSPSEMAYMSDTAFITVYFQRMLSGGADWSVDTWHVRDNLFLCDDDLDDGCYTLVQRFERDGAWELEELQAFTQAEEAVDACIKIRDGARAPGESFDHSTGQPCGEPLR